MEQTKRDSSAHGETVAAISRQIVRLLKEFYGKGPTQAKTYYLRDFVLMLLHGGFTKVEETLLEAGPSETGHPLRALPARAGRGPGAALRRCGGRREY